MVDEIGWSISIYIRASVSSFTTWLHLPTISTPLQSRATYHHCLGFAPCSHFCICTGCHLPSILSMKEMHLIFPLSSVYVLAMEDNIWVGTILKIDWLLYCSMFNGGRTLSRLMSIYEYDCHIGWGRFNGWSGLILFSNFCSMTNRVEFPQAYQLVTSTVNNCLLLSIYECNRFYHIRLKDVKFHCRLVLEIHVHGWKRAEACYLLQR